MPERERNGKNRGWPLQHTLWIWFAIVALICCVSVGGLTYYLRSKGLRQQIAYELALVRDDKARDVELWFIERKDSLAMWVEASGVVTAASQASRGEPVTQRERLVRQLEHLRSTYHCHSVSINSAETGRTLLSSDPADSFHPELPPGVLEMVLASRAVVHTDLFICPLHHTPTLVFAGPIRSAEQNETVGVLAFYMDLDEWFYPQVLGTEQIGETGEILLVNNQGVAQSRLRLIENAPGRAKLSAEPAVKAAAGLTGVIESLDYFSVPVMAAYGALPEIGWGIVVKQDRAELEAPIRAMALQIAVVTLAALLFASAVSLVVARRIAAPATGIASATQRIGQGDTSVRAIAEGPREIQTIARNFNAMMDWLGRQLWTGETLGSVFSAASAHNRLSSLLDEVLPKVMEATRSQLGVFYLSNAGGNGDGGDANEFKCVYGNGTSLENCQAEIHLNPADHLLAQNALSGEVRVIDDLSERHELKIATHSGPSRPAALMSVPLMHSGKPIAILGLGSLCDYRPEHLDVARTLSLSLGQSIAAALASEKNLKMTEELRLNNEELTTANEELQTQTEELQQQSEELQQQAEELAEQRAAVEEADRLKSQFLSNMSHELRTPLNSIMALSQLMLSRGTGSNPEKEAEFLGIIERNGRHLLNLINDILDLSKIESGRMDVIPTRFRPDHVVRRALETARPLAEAKGLAVELDVEEVPELYSDADKVHQILLNLLSNAVKFTDRGKISIGIRRQAERVLISVQDTGIGISEADLADIFDEFRQVDGSTTRRHEGTGLGLAIGQKLARLLGGELAVQSRPGQGSTFTLALPVRAAAQAREEHRPSPQPRAERARSGKTILVADDDPVVRNLLRSYLTDHGYDVLVAANGTEAIGLARAHRPYAITLDVLMPDLDGWEVIRELKANEETASIPILVISVTEDKATALALGASGFLVKPVDKTMLISELERMARIRPVHHILVVDDDMATRQHLKLTLEGRYQTVSTAAGGQEALKLVADSPPDAIILDLMMPDMDGFTVLDHLRRDPATYNIPVLILTAKDLTSGDRQRLRNAVSQIITKGMMDRDRLLEELDRALAELEPAVKASRSTKRVLVVDDDEIAAIQISSALEDAGYHTAVARSGAEALALAREDVPDAVVLDIMMPGMDGFQVLRQLRSVSATAEVPVLILTAKELTAAERARLADDLVRQLIQKGSVDREQMVDVVRELLGEQSAEQAEQVAPEQPPLSGRTPGEQERKASVDGEGGNGEQRDGLILVVEDNPDNLLTMTAVLDDLGHKHAHAANGEQAVKMVRELKPAVVLMDMQLPVLGGLDAVRMIKADPELAHIPIVAVTAKAMRGDREKILQAGCEDYLPKPLDRSELARVLERWVQR